MPNSGGRGGTDDYSRSLGKLEGGIGAIQETLKQVLEWQKDFAHTSAEDRRRMYERLERQESEHAEARREFQRGLDAMAAQAEATGSMGEGHGAALVDLEGRVEALESDQKTELERRRNNLRWVKGILAFMGLVQGDHLTGDKLAKAVLGLVGIKYGAN